MLKILFLLSKIRFYSYKIGISYLLSPFSYACFFQLYQAIFLLFLFFEYIIMYKLTILSALKQMTIKELKDIIYENYYRRIGFPKESSYHSMKHKKKNIC